jgi:hypothetical protein
MKKITLIMAFAFLVLAAAAVSAQTTKRSSAIEKIDFKNFSYGRLCSGGNTWAPLPTVNMALKNGHQNYDKDAPDAAADLTSVEYVDFNGDGNEEAFVVVNGSTAAASGDHFVAAYVFALQNGKARQVWSRCSENSAAKLEGKTIVFSSPEFLKKDPHCCPSFDTTFTYGWKNSGIAMISKKRKAMGK